MSSAARCSVRVARSPFEDCDGSMTWANDSQTLFFAELDETHRPHKLFRHTLGETAAHEVFHEADGRFFLHCYRSSSERQLILLLNSKTTSETWVLDADQPQQAFNCLAPRLEGHDYSVDHGLYEGQWAWFIRTNQDGINFALYYALGDLPHRDEWQRLIAHDDRVMLEGLSLNANALCLSLREGGLPIIEIRPNGLPAYRVQLPDAAYSLYVQDSLEFHSAHIRLRYESLNRPAQVRRLTLTNGAPDHGPGDLSAEPVRALSQQYCRADPLVRLHHGHLTCFRHCQQPYCESKPTPLFRLRGQLDTCSQ